ncbi:MAG TPA: hypothetical protein VJS85_09980 [Rhizomicrobium sp.]|nr:hypothetical protein [Rhizomicrobium sp.]
MKKMIFAATVAMLGGALVQAAAQDYGYRRNHNYANPQVPRAPQAPLAPRAPRENESGQGFTPYQPNQPYQGTKPLRHYNIYTHQWE